MRGRLLAMAALAGLAACAELPPAPGITSVRFGAATLPRGVARSNLDLAEDFLELTFGLESGEKLERLLRYEKPIRIHLASPELAPYRPDLDELIERLRAEAGIDVAETRDPAAAEIRIEAVPSQQISRIFPTAACFIVPGETDWASFMRRRPRDRLRWSDQRTLERAAIFLPLDTTPQDVRDCLNEEVTQALGPANDLYRLPDSVWNDDNFHGMATAFDMLVLRTLYQPELASGMSRPAAAAVLPGVLARTNPRGRGLPPRPRYPESQPWNVAIEAALSRDVPRSQRLAAAAQATRVAAGMRPTDHRLGVALLTLGRLELRRDPDTAARQFVAAYDLLRRRFGAGDIRTAQAGVHLAAIAVGIGQYDTAIILADRHAPAARAGQNAVLLAGLLSIKAEALANLGRTEEAQATRIDSLAWARYGFGDTDGALAREQAQLAALLHLEKP